MFKEKWAEKEAADLVRKRNEWLWEVEYSKWLSVWKLVEFYVKSRAWYVQDSWASENFEKKKILLELWRFT